MNFQVLIESTILISSCTKRKVEMETFYYSIEYQQANPEEQYVIHPLKVKKSFSESSSINNKQ